MPLKTTQRLAEIRGNFPVDSAIISLLPNGSKILSAEAYGTSSSTQTGRITVELPDGSLKKYFLKLALGDHGRQLLQGEFTAITIIAKGIPELVPTAIGWEKHSSELTETYFLLEDFRNMDMSPPSPVKLIPRVIQLHSLLSPNGMFGFPVTTFDGTVPHVTEWEADWTTFFTRLLRKSLECDVESNGVFPSLSVAVDQLLAVVVPILLGKLQSGPDPIIPRLIHGDLWSGNIGQDEETGEVILFDAGSFYAHNELELGMWRRHGVQNLGKPYLDEYKRLFPPAEPQDEFDDRNRLYSLKYDLNHSTGHPGDKARDIAMNNIIYLVQKYAPVKGLPQYDARKDPSAGEQCIYT